MQLYFTQAHDIIAQIGRYYFVIIFIPYLYFYDLNE
jgi:hypothetical protein